VTGLKKKEKRRRKKETYQPKGRRNKEEL